MRVAEREEQTGEAARPQCCDSLEKGAVERAPRPGAAGAGGRGSTWRGAPTGNGSLCGCDRGAQGHLWEQRGPERSLHLPLNLAGNLNCYARTLGGLQLTYTH